METSLQLSVPEEEVNHKEGKHNDGYQKKLEEEAATIGWPNRYTQVHWLVWNSLLSAFNDCNDIELGVNTSR